MAILRTEGSNGDREMAASFHLAGFEPWDVTVSDHPRQPASVAIMCEVVRQFWRVFGGPNGVLLLRCRTLTWQLRCCCVAGL